MRSSLVTLFLPGLDLPPGLGLPANPGFPPPPFPGFRGEGGRCEKKGQCDESVRVGSGRHDRGLLVSNEFAVSSRRDPTPSPGCGDRRLGWCLSRDHLVSASAALCYGETAMPSIGVGLRACLVVSAAALLAPSARAGDSAYLDRCTLPTDCASDLCIADLGGTNFCTRLCSSDAECAAEHVCAGGQCEPDDTGEPCASGGTCATDSVNDSREQACSRQRHRDLRHTRRTVRSP